MILEIAKTCPDTEEKILESVVERLCHLDVDLKTKVRKFQFSKMKIIESLNSFITDLSWRLPSDKEFKMGILFDILL